MKTGKKKIFKNLIFYLSKNRIFKFKHLPIKVKIYFEIQQRVLNESCSIMSIMYSIKLVGGVKP